MKRQSWFWMVCMVTPLCLAGVAATQDPSSPETAPQVPRGWTARADANHDGKLSLDEAKGAFPNMTVERFNALDKNADGFLTPDERPGPPANARPAAREQAQRRLTARIKRADEDQDGKIKLEEALKAFPRMTPERFKALDKNGDGALTRDEFAQGAALMVHPLKQADTDGDHRLSREEAKAAFPNMPDERFRILDKNADGYLTPNELPNPNGLHKSAGGKPKKNGNADKPIKKQGKR